MLNVESTWSGLMKNYCPSAISTAIVKEHKSMYAANKSVQM